MGWIATIIFFVFTHLLFDYFKSKVKIELEFNGEESIYEYVIKNLKKDGRIIQGKESLPDEKVNENRLEWEVGGLDGNFSYNNFSGINYEKSEIISDLLNKISLSKDKQAIYELYNILKNTQTLRHIDSTIELIAKKNIKITNNFINFARFLAFESIDRETVKFGISLIGILNDKKSVSKLKILAHHEEFTLFSLAAISIIIKNPEEYIWKLAKSMEGWGKIHSVKRLINTDKEKIKEWMLLEGYKNNVMYGYSTYICAVSGELDKYISKEKVSDKLLIATSEIIESLIRGGVAFNDIYDYDKGYFVIKVFLEKIKKRKLNINILLTINIILEFVSDENIDWLRLEENEWTKTNRENIMKICKDIIKNKQYLI